MSAVAINPASEKATVVAALQRASAITGSDFHYLLGTAMRESSLKPQAQAGRSSAAGLFQFVEQTWLGLVKDYGAKYGLSSYASAIGKGADGRLHLDNAADRQAVLALRNDPQLSSLMAGEYAQQTKAEMQSTLGRDVCGGELYAAHFLGADAACRLIRMNGSTPGASAASVFPQAASANRNVFYHADGTAKTIREVYGWALNQPSVAVPQTPVAPPPPGPVTYGPDYSGLLASLWTPSKGFFSIGEDGNSAFPLTPGILDILSSVSPVAKDDSGS
ncbi:MAG: lytic transglycosylase domain-containing protein [Alphaproteobacteria bacterium]|nr:lytic transglycosylase domain-containing protein [Alphaproteobacteria bacterium]MDE2630302.1 lytic transglycosylase domain-containing protein [Alphaproteobacteria bacterium]